MRETGGDYHWWTGRCECFVSQACRLGRRRDAGLLAFAPASVPSCTVPIDVHVVSCLPTTASYAFANRLMSRRIASFRTNITSSYILHYNKNKHHIITSTYTHSILLCLSTLSHYARAKVWATTFAHVLLCTTFHLPPLFAGATPVINVSALPAAITSGANGDGVCTIAMGGDGQ